MHSFLLLCLCITVAAKPKTTVKPTRYPTAPPKPHVILHLADDLGWNDVPWNNPAVSMPVVHGMYREGIVLSRHYTARFCAPSRAMIMSGRLPWTIGLHSDINLNPVESMRCMLHPSIPLLPSKMIGYTSYALGKWHLGHYSAAGLPTARGFTKYVGFLAGATIHMGKKQFMSNRCACDQGSRSTCDTTKYSAFQFCTTANDMVKRATSQGLIVRP
jgi:hypothetical protein